LDERGYTSDDQLEVESGDIGSDRDRWMFRRLRIVDKKLADLGGPSQDVP
jgi:hypothetical protein